MKTHILLFGREKNCSSHILYVYNSTLNSKPMELVNHFPYHGSNISSTESELNLHIGMMLTAIERLSIIWNLDLSGKIKWDFL